MLSEACVQNCFAVGGCIRQRRRRGAVQLQKGDWIHPAQPTLYCNYQNRCDQTFWNSDTSKQSQEKVAHSIRGGFGIKIKQFIAFNCRPICRFSHVTAVAAKNCKGECSSEMLSAIHCTSAPVHHCITAPPHHRNTAPLHHCTTTPRGTACV